MFFTELLIEITIVKIEELIDNYLIDAETEDGNVRIVSWKCDICCKNIIEGESYVVSLWKFPDDSFSPCHYTESRGRDNIPYCSEWCIGLFYVNEFYGLCYTLNEEQQDKYSQWLKEVFFPSIYKYSIFYKTKQK